MNEAEARACTSKMDVCLESLNKIREYARECIISTHINVDNIQVRIRRAEELLTQFLEAETKLVAYNNKEVSKFFEVEDIYYAAIGDFNETIYKRKLSISGEGARLQSFSNTTTHNIGMSGDMRDTRLPKLEIPKFSGKYTDWSSFYEMFTQQIHECPRLSEVQKFYYLRSYLTDEAANLVKHINVTAANYAEALDKLRKRYDRKRYTVNSFIRKFIDQRPILQANSSNIRQIYDVSDEVIRGLRSVGTEAESRDPWLIYLVLNKLDENTKFEWAEVSSKDEFPSFKQFLEFLSSRVDALDSYGISTKSTHIKPDRSTKSFATTTIVSKCHLCKTEAHRLYECKQFKELSTDERRKFIADTKRCFNCLNANHNVYNCRFRGRCQKCYRKHHSLLHENQQSQLEVARKNENTPDVTNLHCTFYCNITTKINNK